MNIRKSFRNISLEESTPQSNEVQIDFSTAIPVFKDEYMLDVRSARTVDFHLENLAIFYKYLTLSGDKGTYNVSRHTLGNFVRSMRKADKKMNTINGRIKTMRVFFRVLDESGLIPSNPAAGLKLIKGPKPDIIPFTDQQVQKLLLQPDQSKFTGLRDYLIMSALLDTGLRLDEVCNIRVSDIDIRNGSIHVRKGKGDKSRT